ncbi:MAG: hypothetical protein WC838_02590 [Candidatus Margulisiibacteriota bacterium]|jgi:hypothetical protein
MKKKIIAFNQASEVLVLAYPHCKVVFDQKISLMERLAVLLTDDPAIEGSKKNDRLTLLLKDTAKNIASVHVENRTEQIGLVTSLFNEKLALIISALNAREDLALTKDDRHNITWMLYGFVDLYLQFMELGLMDEAKKLVAQYSGKGRRYFDQNKKQLLAELHTLFNSTAKVAIKKGVTVL